MPKDFDPEDPNELVGVNFPGGDAKQALDSIVQEYLFIGWTAQQILMLFWSPYYGATNQIFRQMGLAHVKERIKQLADQWNKGWIREPAIIQPTGDEPDA